MVPDAEHHRRALVEFRRVRREFPGVVAVRVLLAFFLVIALASRGGLGAGDIRLSGLLGLILGWHGWHALVAGVLSGLLCGAAFGALLIARRRATAQTPIPFGPALLAGTLTALIFR